MSVTLSSDQIYKLSLYQYVRSFDLEAKKALGQNFLIDQNIIDLIVKACDIEHADHIIEIGPGLGSLTRSLYFHASSKMTAVEKDSRFIEALKGYYPDLNLLHQDALLTSFKDLLKEKTTIVGNLPYNISTPLTVHLLKTAYHASKMVFMFQKEVADRLTATKDHKDYSRLSVLANFCCDVVKLFDVSPDCFIPKPKITSSVVEFRFKRQIDPFLFTKLEKVTHHAFSQRRKMIRQSLKSLFGSETMQILDSIGLDPKLRAENLTIDDFIKITDHVT